MRLFNKDDCPFCWKVRIALAEIGREYELTTLGPNDDRGELDTLSPFGTVPVLVDGDAVIRESAVIMECLNDVSDGVLMPGDPVERARTRLLHSYSDRNIGADLREVVFEKRSKPEADWDMSRIAKGEAGWRKHLDWLGDQVGDGTFFIGAFSIADCALYPRFGLAERFGISVDDRHPALLAWYQRLATDPRCTSTRSISWT